MMYFFNFKISKKLKDEKKNIKKIKMSQNVAKIWLHKRPIT